MTKLLSLVAEHAGTSPDAELIGLATDLLHAATRLHRCDAGLLPLPDEEYERQQDRLHEGGGILMRLHPQTLAGLVAKARTVRVQFERLVACDYRGQPGGGETHERLAWSVLNDLLELTGGLDNLPSFPHGLAAPPDPASAVPAPCNQPGTAA